MLVAYINNFIVTGVDEVDEITEDMAKQHQLVIDVTGIDPAPSSGWELYGNKLQPLDLTRLDEEKYKKRAKVKDDIVAWMAAGNMERLRNGTWTLSDISSLTLDAGLKLVLDDVNTLSFELAMGKIDAVTNPLITSDIKTKWKMKLLENLF